MGILDQPGARGKEIKECGEPLEILDPREFVLDPRYYKMGIAEAPEIKLRSGVLAKLREAKTALNKIPGCERWNFKIWDGFRTYNTQQIIYHNYWSDLFRAHPGWDNKKLIEATEKFVSRASVDPAAPAPHNTGGAVDLTLVDENGQEVNMGTPFDEFSERAGLHYFFYNQPDSAAKMADENRMTLVKAMEAAGFVNYPEEWWHFSYGDQMWAASQGADHAIYGSMEK